MSQGSKMNNEWHITTQKIVQKAVISMETYIAINF